MKVYGIIGYPLTHSFSKRYFTEKFQLEGITDCRYENFPIPGIDAYKMLIAETPDLCGLNVTIPYKQQVLSRLDDTTNIPAGLQACNCIRIDGGKTSGFNTDIIGFENSLLPCLRQEHTRALILGSGGAADAVGYVLRKLNIAFTTVSRTGHGQSLLNYADLDERVIQENLLIINTTPLGTFPDVDTFPDIPYQYISTQHLLFDLVYNPSPTVFMQKGTERGATVKNGYDMLKIQAEESWKIWNAF